MTAQEYATAWLHVDVIGAFIQQVLFWCLGAAFGYRMFAVWLRITG